MKTLLAVGFDKIGFMLALLLVLMVWSGISPADRTVWMVESVWSVGLLAVLAVTRKWFKFSTAAIDGGGVGATCPARPPASPRCRGIDEWYGIWY